MRIWMTAILSCLSLTVPGYAQSGSTAPTKHVAKSQQQVLKAFEIAKLAAENGMQSLSLRAVNDALEGGPPTTFAAEPQPLITRSTSIYGTGLPTNRNKRTLSNQLLQEHLDQLDSLWKAKAFSSRAVYDTLASVVLPPGRPQEVFFYEQTMAATSLKTDGVLQPFNAGLLLVDWAVRAKAEDNLNQRLEARKAFPSAQLSAAVLQCMLALRLDDTGDLRKRLVQLRDCLKQNSTGSDAEVAAQLVFPLLGRTDVSNEAASVAELVIDQIITGTSTSKDYHVEPATSILKLVAETYRKNGNPEKVRETVERLLSANDLYNSRYSGSTNNYIQRLKQSQINTAAAIYLNAGMLADAAPLMAEYYELQSVTGRSFGSDHGAKLFRVLMTIAPQERYGLLQTITFGRKGNINLPATLVPRSRPLPIFATTLPSGGNSLAFELPGIGRSGEVLNAAALLASTARQIGKLDELKAQATTNVETASTNLSVVEFFAEAESDDPDYALLIKIINARAASLQAAGSGPIALKAPLLTLSDYSISVRGLEIPEVRDSAAQLMQQVHDSALLAHTDQLIARARQALNYSSLQRVGLQPNVLTASSLQHWHTASCDTAQTHASGSVATSWIAADGYVKALTAPQDGLLYFRYPLTGDFQVSAIITHRFSFHGGFVYDGMLWQNQGNSQEALIQHIGRPNRRSPRVNLTDASRTSQNALDVQAERVDYRINRHVAVTETVSGGSPFLALQASAGETPGFNQLKITGNPQIPRSVQLLSDYRLRGWAPYFSAEKICAAFETKDAVDVDWGLGNGILSSAKRSAAEEEQSLLTFHRPLQNRETIAWEFQYKPGSTMTHPALGRLVFLLRPDGVRLHWVTDGKWDWTGLTGDHEAIDSVAQRRTQLPLLADAWNQAELSLIDGRVQLNLNGQLVFERQHEAQLETQFGFFHNSRAEDVAVRDVVLSGDWPATFEEAISGDLLKPADSHAATSDRRAASGLITADEFEQMGYQLACDTESMPAEDRFRILKCWVLPDRGNQQFRLMGGFVPTHFAAASAAHQDSANRNSVALVSPALQLIQAALELNKLPDLKQDLQAISADGNLEMNRTAQHAMLSAIATAENDFASANLHLNEVFNEARKTSSSAERLWWPELIASWNAIQFPETIDNGIRILDHIAVDRQNLGISGNWQQASPIYSMRGLAHYRRSLAANISTPLPKDGLWKPVTRVTAATSAVGVGEPHWAISNNGDIVHHSGHHEDFLYYDVPLRGNFAVTCELASNQWQAASLMYADHWLKIDDAGKRYKHGRAGFELREIDEATTPLPLEKTYQYRMEVKDGLHRHWVNGTRIFEEQFVGKPDPWLAIRCGVATENGIVRNLKISGTPEIPTEIHVLKQESLEGWTTSHFAQTMRYSGADWTRSGNYIIGAKRTDQKFTMEESLLQYHRPMLEDGEFEYTFAYSTTRHVHPAIGRTAFLLLPDGVQEHTVTNGKHGTANLQPENRTVVSANQLSNALLLTQTNTMKFRLQGNEVTLLLNGIGIYRKTLNTDEQRFFGFFHYPGHSEARISDVIYRGDWKRSLPAE